MSSLRDLSSKIPGASNFTYGEFVKSDTALRKGIKNEPSEEEWKCIECLATSILQPLRNAFGGIRITSGFRSKELCLAVGSSVVSNHSKGQAADIEPTEPGVTNIDLINYIHKNFEYRTVILEYPPDGWVHVDCRVGGNIKELKLKDKTHNYVDFSIESLNQLYS